MPPEDAGLDGLGFNDADLVQTLTENLGVGIDYKLAPADRFALNVARLLRTRLFEAADSETRPCVFFFVGANEVPESADRYEPLLHNGVVVVESCLRFVGETATNARGVTVSDWQDGPAFRMAIEDLAVGGWPAMVFDPRPEATRTRYYPDGVAASDTSREVPLQVSAIDLQDVFEEIDRAHVKQLGSPMTRPKLWEDASKHWPRQDAENRIQEALEMWLQGRYLTCDVRAEQPGASGRLDLEIYVPIGAPNGPKTPGALLELKVLRSYGEKGGRYTEEYTREWIKSGVVQAASYRDDRSFPEAALCCFDMRVELEGVACFAHVADEAEQREVALRLWPIFTTATAYRKWCDAEKYS